MPTLENVAFGGGCFWCTEAVFLQLKGVVGVTSGYAGGTTPNPTYEAVSSGKTGHAEVIRIEYDPSLVSFKTLLDVFFMAHNPTTLNQQGADYGTQYRSIILYSTPAQKTEAEQTIVELTNSKKFPSSIVTEVVPLAAFYSAEDYHKNYFAEHESEGYSQVVIKPKVDKIRREHPELLK